jgi:hypothetical protein
VESRFAANWFSLLAREGHLSLITWQVQIVNQAQEVSIWFGRIPSSYPVLHIFA